MGPGQCLISFSAEYLALVIPLTHLPDDPGLLCLHAPLWAGPLMDLDVPIGSPYCKYARPIDFFAGACGAFLALDRGETKGRECEGSDGGGRVVDEATAMNGYWDSMRHS